MSEDDLAGLMTAYQAGDLRAFEALYQALNPRLFRYLLVLTRNRNQAEDRLQETFLQIHRSRRTYAPGRPVIPWVFAIARHVYLMDVRKRTRVQRQEIAVSSDALPDIPVPPEAEHLADSDRLQRALHQLPADQVEALTLHHVWGLTFAEIGATLGVRAGTAKVRAFRGMQTLKKIFGQAL